MAMEEQPVGNGKAERAKICSKRSYKVAIGCWMNRNVPMEEQPVGKQKCGNGRAGIWQWKSRTPAKEVQHFGNGRVKDFLSF